MAAQEKYGGRALQRAAALSIVAGFCICLTKFAAYALTNSAAIFSDAIESINNVLAASFAAYAILQSARAPDRDHPFGRGRLEYLSAGFEGGLIVLAALAILYESVPRLWNPPELRALDLGLLLTAAASAANAGLGWHLIRTGRRHSSDALIADGKHVLADVITSVGTIVALVVVYFSGWTLLDPLLACLLAGWILLSGFRILRNSFHRLIDRVRPETFGRLAGALREIRRPEMILPHRLRVRESGPAVEVDFHLIVPRFFTVEQLHALETNLLDDLERQLGRRLDLMIHSDPCRSLHCEFCRVADCPVRSKEAAGDCLWDEASLRGDGHAGLAAAERYVPPLP